MVVPRASIPAYLAKVGELAQASGSFIVGCGHAGDGNVTAPRRSSPREPEPGSLEALVAKEALDLFDEPGR